jgi:Putative phage tail protein
MATLILNAVGAAVGGPIGAAIGATIGQLIDQRLLAPKGRQGPRLGDLAFQSSSYGARIPKLFGAMRVSGSVIWATDLKENRSKQSTGKGRPKQTVYSYTASFAVALSARRIARVGRIWADGKLLRGAAGDFKTETGFRVYLGTETQNIDPLIASIQGAGQSPAYRGLAYVVFEDLQLAEYGNRIPSLSFEVIADTGDIAIDVIVTNLAPGVVTSCPTKVGGFAANGDSVRGVLETVSAAVSLILSDNGYGLAISEQPVPALGPIEDDLGAAPLHKSMVKISRERRADARTSGQRVLRFYDPARDYQTGLQRARRARVGRHDDVLDWPATLSADQAAALADRLLAADLADQDAIEISLPWRYVGLRPGQVLRVPGVQGLWRALSTVFEGMTVRVTLVAMPLLLPTRAGAEAGRGVLELDQPHGPTILRMLDLPQLTDGVATTPQVFAVAAGVQPGWRAAALLQSVNDGASWDDIGATAAPATMGIMQTTLGPAQTHCVDRRETAIVQLAHDAMTLSGSDQLGLLGGRNLALVGDELIQFERADQIGLARYALSGLLRGRRGTEWAVAAHGANDPFTLIDASTMAPLSLSAGAASVRLMAMGVGDMIAVEAQIAAPGAALRPASPVHVTAETLTNADIMMRWTRRSRDGWRWIDGVDAPLAEELERYRVTVTPNIGVSRALETAEPQWAYRAADIAADRAAGATLTAISIAQIGMFATSRPATLSVPL